MEDNIKDKILRKVDLKFESGLSDKFYEDLRFSYIFDRIHSNLFSDLHQEMKLIK